MRKGEESMCEIPKEDGRGRIPRMDGEYHDARKGGNNEYICVN